MKALVIGGGGREHALAWKLAQSAKVQKVFVAPGNAGTAAEPHLQNVDIADLDRLADFALEEKVDLTVVGPEAALAAGAVDKFRAKGPAHLRADASRGAARELEGVRQGVHAAHGIPTAALRRVRRRRGGACARRRGAGADRRQGRRPRRGQGRRRRATRAEAHAAIDAMLGGGQGGRVVIEEFLEGEEASFMVVSDGTSVLSLATSQDHKRIGDGDTGPNTGGMGAYSPAPVVTPNVHARVMQEIVLPTIAGMADEGMPFSGFLYAGLMIDAHGAAKTVEFNCRLGDPRRSRS
jgi:phosphoribosylamine--glycine ligase